MLGRIQATLRWSLTTHPRSRLDPPLQAGGCGCKPAAASSAQKGSCLRSLYFPVEFVKQVPRAFISLLTLLPSFLCLVTAGHSLRSLTLMQSSGAYEWMWVVHRSAKTCSPPLHGLWKWKPRSSSHPALCFQKRSPYVRCFCYCLDALLGFFFSSNEGKTFYLIFTLS